MNCSPPGSSVHGISQTRILEWVAISFLQGIFLAQGLNPHPLRWQADSLPLNHQLRTYQGLFRIPIIFGFKCYIKDGYFEYAANAIEVLQEKKKKSPSLWWLLLLPIHVSHFC